MTIKKLPKPYYQDDVATLYHGDSLDILPLLDPCDVVVTDPIWPDCEKIFPGVDAYQLFSAAAQHFPRLCKRLCVIMGCDSDPRMLRAVPPALKFFRVSWMGIVPARYRGSLLAASEVLYTFGERYLNKDAGQVRCVPGETRHVFRSNGKFISDHPCPRYMNHMEWIIGNYTRPGATIIDPFMGTGTIGRAVKNAGGAEVYRH